MTDERLSAETLRDWRKSSYSGGQGDCVEVARSAQGATGVRDSKDQEGAVLTFPGGAWEAFISSVCAGGFQAEA